MRRIIRECMLQGVQSNLHPTCVASQKYPYQVGIWPVFTSNTLHRGLISDCKKFVSILQCFFPQHALPYIRTPYFTVNSAYDVYQVKVFPISIASQCINRVHWHIYMMNDLDLHSFRLVSVEQFHHIFVPPSADPRGHWSGCKSNPGKCTRDQINILQGYQFCCQIFSSPSFLYSFSEYFNKLDE